MPSPFPADTGIWLERFEQPQLLRASACFHRYAALDARTGDARLVIVGAPGQPAAQAQERLDEAARVLDLLDHARIPAVDDRGRVGEIEYLSLCCNAHDDVARLLEHLAASGIKLSMEASSGLADRFLDAIGAAHETTDPNTGGPVCLGRFAWANVLLSERGEPWFLGWGDDLLVPQPDYTGSLVVAPEVMLGARPTRGSDLWAVLTLFRALFALRRLPAPLERIMKGHPRPQDDGLRQRLDAIHRSILAPPERRAHDVRAMHDGYREVWSMLDITPSLDAFRGAVADARRRSSSEPPGAGPGRGPDRPDHGRDLGRSRYRVERELGAGSTSVVYLARDRQLGVDVAIKSLRGDAHPRTFARFLREARLLRRIAHPHVVRGFEVEVYDGGVFLVMEYIAGPSLAAWAPGAAPAARIAVLGQVADALRTLHDIRVVHGDIKPANIIVTPDRGAVVVDLGGARELGAADRALSLAAGTVGYLAPERRDGEPATPPSDVYSFAVTAIEVLAGGRIEGAGASSAAMQVAEQVAEQVPKQVAEQVPKQVIGSELTRLLRAALAKEPAARPSAAELARALAPRPAAGAQVEAGGVTVEPEARGFRVAGGERVDLSRRHAARRILWALAKEALSPRPAPLSTTDLLERGWPGERVLPEAGAHRVHVAVATLRKLGLGDLIVRGESGYRLSGAVAVRALPGTPEA